MTSRVLFLTLEQVLAFHNDQIDQYGGSHGLRDLNLLISALERPKASFGGEDLYSTIFDKAAALMHSILLNHPFIDGNKRTSIVAGSALLEFNGYQLTAMPELIVKLALAIESKKMDIAEIADWLKEHSNRTTD